MLYVHTIKTQVGRLGNFYLQPHVFYFYSEEVISIQDGTI